MKISKSKLNTYKKCPREFKYIYVDKMESEPNEYMRLGTDVHANAENFARKFQELEEITYQDILEVFEKYYVESEFDISEHMASLVDFFTAILIDENYHIFSIEERISNEEIGVRGIIDIVLEDENGDLTVIDYKSSKSKPIKDYRLELCIYKNLIESKYPSRTVVSGCIFFTKDSVFRGVNFTNDQLRGSYITDEDYNAVFDYIKHVKEKIDEGDFPPKKQFLCKYCNFVEQCNQDGGF